jgi:hypothetical protein
VPGLGGCEKVLVHLDNDLRRLEKGHVRTDEDLFQTTKGLVRTKKGLLQRDEDLVRTEEDPFGTDKDLVRTDEDLFQTTKGLVRANKDLLQTDEDLVRTEEGLFQTDKDLGRTDEALLQTDRDLGRTNEDLLQTKNALVRRNKGLLRTDAALFRTDEGRFEANDAGGPSATSRTCTNNDRGTTTERCPMSTTKSVHRSIVSLDLPKKVPALISYATSVVTAMTGNPSFPTPAPTLAEVTAAITALQTAQAAAIARTKGAVTARNDKQAALVSLLQEMKAYIQKIADADAENSAAVIQSAGVSVKKTAVRKPRVFGAEQGAVSGTVKLVAASAGHRSSYEWMYSVDGGKTWVSSPATLQAKTSVAGLTPGVTVQFRYLAVTKTGQGDWSQPVSLLVK